MMTPAASWLACTVSIGVLLASTPVSGLSQSTATPAEPAALGAPQLRVAVMDLSGSALRMQTTQLVQPIPGGAVGQVSQTSVAIPPPAEFARGLTEALTTSLVRTNRFVVLERAALQQVQQEQDFAASGRVNKETASEQGRMIGAQVLITGDITAFTHERSSLGGKVANILKGVTASVERVSAAVTIDLRLIDATTGEVIASVKAEGKSSQTGLATDLVKDEKRYDGSVTLTTPLGIASRSAIQKAVAEILLGMPKVRWSARVIDVRDGLIYLNAGRPLGVRAGLALEVFEPQPALIDPESGRNLGAPDKLIGEIVVESVEEQYATARVAQGSGFKRNQVVRVKGTGARP